MKIKVLHNFLKQREAVESLFFLCQVIVSNLDWALCVKNSNIKRDSFRNLFWYSHNKQPLNCYGLALLHLILFRRLFRAHHHDHSFPFKLWQLVYFTNVFQVLRKF